MRLLVVGCGDVGQRFLGLLPLGVAVTVLARDPDKLAAWRGSGVRLLRGDLDQPASLARLAGAFDAVLHLAPPPGAGGQDSRTRHLLAALGRGHAPRRFVYVSTTGVYGDCQGARIDETAPRRAATERARRRVDAEDRLRDWARSHAVALAILRAPGIYAADREGHPRERLLAGRPLLRPEDDVFTNHIHADDLARACWRALFLAGPLRAYNVVDDSERRMGEHFDLAADRLGLPRALRVSRADAQQLLTPMQLSFLGESRRIGNARMKRELRLRLQYPLPEQGW
ncbi:nucleoside-diphosphate-sugar epimerase [Inhella inkyongensis]|uniref:Nucleoside-diphosphate-sugar epimerase n=1 Tax=Inhella inkyongensis TaxID=392593 RepID=A0A840S702_9BURK|nr:NAD(P)H-binding protein [Inhella inkyongensis]MBB5205288.1 nucleoside-diphosphate-sugar epimerase [Inhella inkyongensis]